MLPFAATQTNPEDLISDRDKYCTISFTCAIFTNRKQIHREIRFVVIRDWGR